MFPNRTLVSQNVANPQFFGTKKGEEMALSPSQVSHTIGSASTIIGNMGTRGASVLTLAANKWQKRCKKDVLRFIHLGDIGFAHNIFCRFFLVCWISLLWLVTPGPRMFLSFAALSLTKICRCLLRQWRRKSIKFAAGHKIMHHR